jgi:hypothetical protein
MNPFGPRKRPESAPVFNGAALAATMALANHEPTAKNAEIAKSRDA